MSTPTLSIIIPAYGRPAPLVATLDSARAVAQRVHTEILLVDDGSVPPLTEQLPVHALSDVRLIRQDNAGSIEARLHGLTQARGEYIKFLDSDDLLDPAGVQAQVEQLHEFGLDIVYGDIGRAPTSPSPAARAMDMCTFVLVAQPAPHAPMYRRTLLTQADLRARAVPADRMFCAAGDVWLYANLLGQDARIEYVPGIVGGVGTHNDGRYSDCWERLGLVGGTLLWCLAQAHQTKPELSRAIGRAALSGLRTLPYGTPYELHAVYLKTWKQLDPAQRLLDELPSYKRLSRLMGFRFALALARWRRTRRYRDICTMQAAELQQLTRDLHQCLSRYGLQSPWSASSK